MKWSSFQDVQNFIDNRESLMLDIRKQGNGRWIDQKCTPDVLTIIADCIINFVSINPEMEYFTSKDIWKSEYTCENVQMIFKKPSLESKKTQNEYDKFFAQPLELLAYSGVLSKEKRGLRNYYKVKNIDILYFISINEINSLKFLNMYITRVLKASELWNVFQSFFDNPNKTTFNILKRGFANFTKANTKINGDTECNRIFPKVLNPLSFMLNTYGTIRGNISKHKIGKDDLMYNRENFRDVFNSKPKDITRGEHLSILHSTHNDALSTYQVNKAKRVFRDYNADFNGGYTEVREDNHLTDLATHIHRIFPEHEFNMIAHFFENFIALTPTQHINYAHVNGNTSMIDVSYQQVCLISKSDSIENSINNDDKSIYTFDNFKYVLNCGLRTQDFSCILDNDFEAINKMITNKYIDILKETNLL